MLERPMGQPAQSTPVSICRGSNVARGTPENLRSVSIFTRKIVDAGNSVSPDSEVGAVLGALDVLPFEAPAAADSLIRAA